MKTSLKSNRSFKAKIFYGLSDTIRLRILDFLRDGEKCVCEIVPHLGLAQPLVSRHLKILKDSGLVRFRKDGTKRMYSSADPRIYAIIDDLSLDLLDNLEKEILLQLER